MGDDNLSHDSTPIQTPALDAPCLGALEFAVNRASEARGDGHAGERDEGGYRGGA